MASRFNDIKTTEASLEQEYQDLKDAVEAATREQERIRREADEARRREEARRQAMNDYLGSLQGCGMTPLLYRQDPSLTIGFEIETQGVFVFDEPVNVSQAKAALLMARACYWGMADQAMPDVCTDGLGPIQANWGDPEFKHGLEMATDNGQYDSCLRALRSETRPPQSLSELNAAVARYRRAWKAAAGRQMRETQRQYQERQAALRQEELDRQERWADRHDPANRTHTYTYDLTPVYDALQGAHRTVLP